MKIAQVKGKIVSTIKNEHLKGKKILIVQPLGLDGNPEGEALMALDACNAGVGDRVLVLEEGSSARLVFGDNDIPVQAVIMGIIDQIKIEYDIKEKEGEK